MSAASGWRATLAIIGGGPAGLAAAEVLAVQGHEVHIFDAMPSFGRKVLLAGKTGLNLTPGEPYETFAARYGASSGRLRQALDAFTPQDVIAWANGLGAECFIGTSGRVFPKAMKASPLMRAWLMRLADHGVLFHTRHRWTGFSGKALQFATPEAGVTFSADACLLALGGASWPRLGSDAAWVDILKPEGIAINALKPANCGFDVAWSEDFRERFAGTPVKSVVATSDMGPVQGEFVISRHGIEGSLVYAHAAALRTSLEQNGKVDLVLDLAPGRSIGRLVRDLARQPAKLSFSNRLRKGAGLDKVKTALLRECMSEASQMPPDALARTIKALSVPLLRPRPIAEAISSSGGIAWEAIKPDYELEALSGIFVAGEMIDWEASTGGYLLSACLATGRAAAEGMKARLQAGFPARDRE